MSCSWVTPIDGAGYVVRPRDGVNGVRCISLPELDEQQNLTIDLPDGLIFGIRVKPPREKY
jgi:hypothetical protein